MRVSRNARKHGITVEEIRQVLAAPLCTVAQGDSVLLIGLTRRRDLVELVVTGTDPVTVLHAMPLRPANYPHLAAPRPPPNGPVVG